MKKKISLLFVLLLPALAGGSKLAMVTGERPEQYVPPDLSALEAVLKQGSAAGLSAKDILKQSATVHGGTVVGSTDRQARTATGHSASAEGTDAAASQSALCPAGFTIYNGELGALWDPIIGNPGLPVPNSTQCIQKTIVPDKKLTLYTGVRVIQVNGQPQGVTISSKFGPEMGVLVQYVIHDKGRKQIYHNYFVKTFDDLQVLKTTLTTGDKITYDGIAPDPSCATNPHCTSDPAKTGYQLQVEHTVKP